MFRQRFHLRRALAILLAVTIVLPQAVLAQTPAKPAAASPAAEESAMQKIELLFVQNSTGMQYDKAKGTLRMKNISSSTLFFADRPVRMAGHYHTKGEFLKLWTEGPNSFAKNPPNATVSIVEPAHLNLQNVVVNLRNPRLQGNDLVYDIKLIEGTLPEAAGAAVLFIDVFGVWRRHVRRWAVVGTTAAVATAGAAEASAAAAQQQAAAAQAAAAKPPATVNVQVTETAPKPAAAAPQSAATQKLEQLKSMLGEGLITQAQYQKASQQVINEMVK